MRLVATLAAAQTASDRPVSEIDFTFQEKDGRFNIMLKFSTEMVSGDHFSMTADGKLPFELSG